MSDSRKKVDETRTEKTMLFGVRLATLKLNLKIDLKSAAPYIVDIHKNRIYGVQK